LQNKLQIEKRKARAEDEAEGCFMEDRALTRWLYYHSPDFAAAHKALESYKYFVDYYSKMLKERINHSDVAIRQFNARLGPSIYAFLYSVDAARYKARSWR